MEKCIAINEDTLEGGWETQFPEQQRDVPVKCMIHVENPTQMVAAIVKYQTSCVCDYIKSLFSSDQKIKKL